jgi:LPS-assembly lipoprotein
LHVGFQAADSAGKAMVEPTELEVSRIITYSESAPLAKEAEEQLLFNDMYREAAEQILRRIAVLRAEARRK